MRTLLISVCLTTFSLSLQAVDQTPPAWVATSNNSAQLLLAVSAKYSPEGAASMGVNGLDEQIMVPSADMNERLRRDLVAVQAELEKRLATEQNALVRQDLEILIDAVNKSIHSDDVTERTLLPYSNAARIIFFGEQSLLDDQVAPERRQAAAVRLRKYTGLEPGYTPLTQLLEERWREKLNKPGLLGPSKDEVEKDLSQTNTFVTGIGLMLEKYKIQGYQPAYAKLKEQLAAYDEFIRKEVLPKARTDFRLPPELYQTRLESFGVDYPIDELARLARESFKEIQAEMQVVAAKVARERNLPSSDYRAVIRELKKEQLKGDQILPYYQARLAEIEAIIRREHLLTLPERAAVIRLASAAETAQQPAPHMHPPRLLNNTGERGEFILPLETTGQGGKALRYDDFTFAAASWTLTAHEARPGHELQFDAMVERGVSLARALFAFNSTNVEGWGLYAEWFMLPYMTDEGKLISLQLRLQRAARAFLDPELQEGKITPAEAMQVMQKDVVLSEAFATEELERFTYRSPGQAVSYFDGYLRLREIRKEAEKAMGAQFNVQRFHDFILSQGLLPPNLLRKAVLAEFVPRQTASASPDAIKLSQTRMAF
jgi:Bacterial protein of unknown function (DUF885)